MWAHSRWTHNPVVDCPVDKPVDKLVDKLVGKPVDISDCNQVPEWERRKKDKWSSRQPPDFRNKNKEP